MGSAAGSGSAGSGALELRGTESALHLATRSESAVLGALEGANEGAVLGLQSFSQPQDLGSYVSPRPVAYLLNSLEQAFLFSSL